MIAAPQTASKDTNLTGATSGAQVKSYLGSYVNCVRHDREKKQYLHHCRILDALPKPWHDPWCVKTSPVPLGWKACRSTLSPNSRSALSWTTHKSKVYYVTYCPLKRMEYNLHIARNVAVLAADSAKLPTCWLSQTVVRRGSGPTRVSVS